ncbi:hypothetical protein K1719_003336 [Acacia pycnantha]|nr:hypothetical protein K1719_003336 [Acacia pycnantha]
MMGELNYFLGLQIKQSKNNIFISQTKYLRDLLKKYGLCECNGVGTPMSLTATLDVDVKGKDFNIKRYRGMIESLLYLTASRPDIHFNVGMCVRFQSATKESHVEHMQRIFKYLADTEELGLWFPKGQPKHLVAYSDSNHTGYKTDRKSTSGHCEFLSGLLVSWFSKKQTTVLVSSTEVEYIATSSCCAQVMWLKQQVQDLRIHLKEISILCDNTSTISLAKNPVQHTWTKHIDVKHHFIRDHVQKKDVKVMFILTYLQLANIFSKPLAKEQFVFFRRELGMVNPNELKPRRSCQSREPRKVQMTLHPLNPITRTSSFRLQEDLTRKQMQDLLQSLLKEKKDTRSTFSDDDDHTAAV